MGQLSADDATVLRGSKNGRNRTADLKDTVGSHAVDATGESASELARTIDAVQEIFCLICLTVSSRLRETREGGVNHLL